LQIRIFIQNTTNIKIWINPELSFKPSQIEQRICDLFLLCLKRRTAGYITLLVVKGKRLLA